MKEKKAIAWLGALLILGLGLAFSADSPQKAARNSFQNTVKSGFQKGPLFVDENNDGICDLARNGNMNGTPNPQNPDWSKQKEKKSYQHKNDNNGSSDQNRKRFSQREENQWNRQSPRENRQQFGNGICDQTGPKAKRTQKGSGQK